jgi:hypothetical protein
MSKLSINEIKRLSNILNGCRCSNCARGSYSKCKYKNQRRRGQKYFSDTDAIPLNPVRSISNMNGYSFTNTPPTIQNEIAREQLKALENSNNNPQPKLITNAQPNPTQPQFTIKDVDNRFNSLINPLIRNYIEDKTKILNDVNSIIRKPPVIEVDEWEDINKDDAGDMATTAGSDTFKAQINEKPKVQIAQPNNFEPEPDQFDIGQLFNPEPQPQPAEPEPEPEPKRTKKQVISEAEFNELARKDYRKTYQAKGKMSDVKLNKIKTKLNKKYKVVGDKEL